MKIEKTHFYIIGCGVADERLSSLAEAIIQQSDIVAGGARLLEKYATGLKNTVSFNSELVQQIEELKERVFQENLTVTVLASGDPLFHGIGATVSKVVEHEFYSVIPAITAFQSLFAKLKVSWSDCSFFSIHKNSDFIPWRKILRASKALIYCNDRMTAADLAAFLIEKHELSEKRRAVAALNLGSQREVVFTGSLKDISQKEFAGLSMLYLAEPAEDFLYPELPLGLPDDFYSHQQNMITHPELRAIILAKFGLRDGIFWDIGGGSGSVGIEAAELCSALRVYTAEKNKIRFEDIRKNIFNNGLENVKVYNQCALELIDRLPVADFVFLGGGGKDIAEIAEKSFNRLNKHGKLIAVAVTVETNAILSGILKKYRREVLTVNISRAKETGNVYLMKSENPVTIYVFRKDEE